MTAGAPKPDLPDEVARAADDPENRMGHYIRVSRLGAGGMGEVWKSWDTELQRWVAVKILKHEDPNELLRFQREGQTAARLNHPNIGAVFEVGEKRGRPFIAMQYVDGITLSSFPRHKVNEIVQVMRDAALAVHHANSQGVIHRDIKPANIMVEEGGRVFVMDFGLAKHTSVDSSLSASGMVIGSPAYMPPEQAQGRLQDLGPGSDVYSLGATLYELLTDQPPFQGPNIYDVIKKVVDDEPLRIRKLNPGVSPDLETIVLKCLQKDASVRYASAESLARDLERYRNGEAIEAHPPSTLYRLRKFVLRRKAVLAAGMFGLVVAGAVAGYFIPRWLEDRGALQRKVEREALLRKARPHLDKGREYVRRLEMLMVDPDADGDDLGRVIEDAQRCFNLARKINPGYVDALLAQGRLYRIVEEPQAAMKCISRAVELDGQRAAVYMERAMVLAGYYVDEVLGHMGNASPTPAYRKVRDDLESDLRKALELSIAEEERGLVEGLLSLVDGQFERAGTLLTRHSRTSGADPMAYAWAGLAWFNAGRYAEAVDSITQLLKYRPSSFHAYHTRGLARDELKEWEGAIRDYSNALRLRPGAYGMLNNRALSHRRNGDSGNALRDHDAAIRLAPEDPVLFFNRGQTRRLAGDLAGALRDFDETIRLDPDDPRFWYQRAATLTKMGENEAAEKAVNHALNLSGDDAKLYRLRGAVRGNLGRDAEAVADLDRAIQLEPDNAEAYVNRGVIHYTFDRPEASAADYQRAIDLDPDYARAYEGRSKLRKWLKNYAGAEQDLTQLIRLAPTWKAHLDRGIMRHAQGKLGPAGRDYDEAIRLDPKQPESYRNRARIRFLQKDAKGAIEDASMVVKLRPDDGESWGDRAEYRSMAGDVEGALKDCAEAIRIAPGNPEVWWSRGIVLGTHGRIQDALKDLRKALEVAPADWSKRGQVEAFIRKYSE